MELPPRARRIQAFCFLAPSRIGTTSACAENTFSNTALNVSGRNYLRVRGEYLRKCSSKTRWLELPPRARRILIADHGHNNLNGTTSACAENTGSRTRYAGGHWNYLRVRGEYRCHAFSASSRQELPPRARRIQGGPMKSFSPCGTTSACAENTTHHPRRW